MKNLIHENDSLKQRRDLVEVSNEFYETFCNYIDEKGFNELTEVVVETNIKWLLLMAKRNGIKLNIEIE